MTLGDAQHASPARQDDRMSDELDHLQRLIADLRRVAPTGSDDERELALMAGDVSASTAELHLRALGTLLATLDTFLRGRRPAPRAGGTRAAHADDADDIRDRPDAALAAAAAHYIARDLAARRLSEFTSAEGYRLARTLARLGDVEEPIGRLLAEANTIRLHPPSLTDAVSHSAG